MRRPNRLPNLAVALVLVAAAMAAGCLDAGAPSGGSSAGDASDDGPRGVADPVGEPIPARNRTTTTGPGVGDNRTGFPADGSDAETPAPRSNTTRDPAGDGAPVGNGTGDNGGAGGGSDNGTMEHGGGEPTPAEPSEPEPPRPRTPVACRPGDAPDELLCDILHSETAATATQGFTFDIPANVHWICFTWTVTTSAGSATVNVIVPGGDNVTLHEPAGAGGKQATMIEAVGHDGEWRVDLVMDAWSGELDLAVTKP